MIAGQLRAAYRLANRREIENEIERLIGLLDAVDAPLADLEPESDYCAAGDDGCGMVRAVQGGLAWGSTDEEPGKAMPRYGVDQSRGPINQREETLAYERRLRAGWAR